MHPSRTRAATVACALFSFLGCAATTASPRDALRAYADAIAEGRADDAYRLLADDARRGTSLESFRAMVKKNHTEALELGKSLARPTEDPYVTALIPLPSGDIVTMVLENGRWRVEGSALEFYGQSTPRQAIVGFSRAFGRERWDILLTYTPEAQRSVLTEARLKEAWGLYKNGEGKLVRPPEGDRVSELLDAIRTALPTAAFEETGDRAAMSYGGGAGVVTFVRERGAWKVEDLR